MGSGDPPGLQIAENPLRMRVFNDLGSGGVRRNPGFYVLSASFVQ
jgi:hypothetical protein